VPRLAPILATLVLVAIALPAQAQSDYPNRPITLVNHAEGPHSFDLLDDSETSRRIIRQVLDFLTSQLTRAGS